MFEDQTVQLLPARTTMSVHRHFRAPVIINVHAVNIVIVVNIAIGNSGNVTQINYVTVGQHGYALN